MQQPFFYVRREKRYEQILFDDIIYIKAKKGYIQIVTEQHTFLIMNTLTELSKHLPTELFCRIHHSYTVAIKRIKAFDRLWVWLHEAPEGKPFKAGLARATELAVGYKYRVNLRNSVTMMLNKSGGHTNKFKKGKVLLEVLEEAEED